MSDLNNNGLLIATIIIYIIFFISIIIIINEIINITIFCYKYTYLYNYGNLNEKTCLNDETTSILEYEKSRFRIYNIIDDYKLKNDLFNKNWINYISYLAISLLTIIICIGFGIVFKYYFIENNDDCIKTPNAKDASFLRQLMLCFFNDYARYIPNCTINYFMLFIIIVVYPLIYLFKVFFKIDFTPSGGYWTKINHIIFFILLLYYAIVLFRITKDNKTVKLAIYLSYVVIFYIAYFVFDYTFNDYNRPDKVSNIYDNKNDKMFFDIYKQTAPLKPTMPQILQEPLLDSEGNNLLTTFKYLTAKDFNYIETMIGVISAGFNIINSTPPKDERTIAIYCKEIGNILASGGDNIDVIMAKYFINRDGQYETKSENVHYYVYLAHLQLTKPTITVAELTEATTKANQLANYTPATTLTSENKNTIYTAFNTQIFKYAKNETVSPAVTKSATIIADVKKQKETFRNSYNEKLKKINDYYKAKKDYDEELDNYNRKYNVFKNTNVEFPKLIFILYDICPKLFGLDKKIVIMIIVAIICYIIIYFGLTNYYNDNDNSNYLYNTILIYLIGIISIFIISNSVLTYNTYFNKYLIYEPTVQYKYDLNNLNTIFNISLEDNAEIKQKKVDFYEKMTNTKSSLTTITGITGLSPTSVYINQLKTPTSATHTSVVNAIITSQSTTLGGASSVIVADTVTLGASVSSYSSSAVGYKTSTIDDNVVITILRRAIFSVLYSASIDLSLSDGTASGLYLIYNPATADAAKYTPLYVAYTNLYNTNLNKFYENTHTIIKSADTAGLTSAAIPAKTHITSIVKTFFLMIKKIFLGDVSKIDDKINTIKRNLQFIIYKDAEIDNIIKTINSENIFYKDFLFSDDISQSRLDEIVFANYKNHKIVKQYKFNMSSIEEILKIYEEYILEFRKIIVDLFNSVGYCNSASVINIDQQLKDYYKKVFIKNTTTLDDTYLIYNFKTTTDEPFIEIYKKKLLDAMNNANTLFIKYFNIMKFLTLYTIKSETTPTPFQNNITSEIINNYNVFNKDNNKYTDNNLFQEPFKVQCNYMNKFSNFSLKDKTEQEINMNNVSWSFIILVIIFAIILLEPTII
jgi:hypothetical protein